MQVYRFYVPDSLQNYNHLLMCNQTHKTAVIDPYSATQVNEALDKHGVSLDLILLTHEHGDHVAGTQELVRQWNVPVYGHQDIPLVNQPVAEGDVITIGNETITTLFTPGHTLKHLCFTGTTDEHQPFLICADTLFNAGVGNTRSGDTHVLFETISRLESVLSSDCLIYPAHDYMLTNLGFSRTVEQDNEQRDQLETRNRNLSHNDREVTDWQTEQAVNPFLRLHNKQIIAEASRQTGKKLTTDEQVFTALRSLRDQW